VRFWAAAGPAQKPARVRQTIKENRGAMTSLHRRTQDRAFADN
jgi:hypothetical protein